MLIKVVFNFRLSSVFKHFKSYLEILGLIMHSLVADTHNFDIPKPRGITRHTTVKSKPGASTDNFLGKVVKSTVVTT